MNKQSKKILALDGNEDILFSNRVEERFCMSYKSAIETIARHDLREDTSAATWIRSTYFDTNEQALPLTASIRVREYLKERKVTLDLDYDREYLIDVNNSHFTTKNKLRETDTIKNTIAILNASYPIRATSFRPYGFTVYYRQVFVGNGFRATLDKDVEFFKILEDGGIQNLKSENLARIEVKYLQDHHSEPQKIISALRENGAVPTISKHNVIYTLEHAERSRIMWNDLEYEFPDSEYELKFSANNSEEFMKCYLTAVNNGFSGFELWKTQPVPLTMASLNEYRDIIGEQKIARVMYKNESMPKIVIKDKGTLTSTGILLRREEKDNIDCNTQQKVMASQIVGLSKRIKTYFYLQSKNTQRVYAVSMDLTETLNNAELYQLEVEYCGTSAKIEVDSKPEVLGEINEIGKIIDNLTGLKRTSLRKEDFVAAAYRHS